MYLFEKFKQDFSKTRTDDSHILFHRHLLLESSCLYRNALWECGRHSLISSSIRCPNVKWKRKEKSRKFFDFCLYAFVSLAGLAPGGGGYFNVSMIRRESGL